MRECLSHELAKLFTRENSKLKLADVQQVTSPQNNQVLISDNQHLWKFSKWQMLYSRAKANTIATAAARWSVWGVARRTCR